MLEISHARDIDRAPGRPPAGPKEPSGVPRGPRRLGKPLGLVKMDLLTQKNIVFQYEMLKVTTKASG